MIKNWIGFKDGDGNIVRTIDVRQIRCISKYMSTECVGRGLRAKTIEVEKSEIQFLNGDKIIVDAPISKILEELDLSFS